MAAIPGYLRVADDQDIDAGTEERRQRPVDWRSHCSQRRR